jgi:quercetin 2,3-dioxygenase
MMKNRQAGFVFAPTPTDEAPGVTIRRAIGGERMAILDPFLLLDHPTVAASSDVVGFPRHPHRGIETLSYVLVGEVGHKDSLGNEGTVGAGGAQWMTAGNGIFHEEMLIPGPDGAEFLQLWFSLPRDQKRIAPAYVGAQANEVPEVVVVGATVRVVAGSFQGVEGPFHGIAVQPTVLDVSLEAGQSLDIPTAAGEAAIL